MHVETTTRSGNDGNWGACRPAAFPPDICRSGFGRLTSVDEPGTGKSGGNTTSLRLTWMMLIW